MPISIPRPIKTVALLLLIVLLASSSVLMMPLRAGALNDQELGSFLNTTVQNNPSTPTAPNSSITEQLRKDATNQESKFPLNPLNTSISPLALQGETYVSPLTTSSKSPTIGGFIPSYCHGVGLVVFADTANLDTGEGMYGFTSHDGEVAVETGFVSDYRVWSFDLAANGLGLINGKYNIYVSSPCDDDEYGNNDLGRDFSNPLFDDIHYGILSIVPAVCNESCTPVYRFYNAQSGAHFYTSNDSEKRDILNTSKQYRYEGIVNFALISQEGALIPVHRFYNLKTGTHFYTASQSEATRVNNTMSHTYRYEGVAYYTNSGPVSNSIPVHRFYKFNQGVHFFTSNQAEATAVNNTMSHAYRYEGAAYYNIANE